VVSLSWITLLTNPLLLPSQNARLGTDVRKIGVKLRQLEAMTLEELWALHDQLTDVLAAKVESKKKEVERQLAELGRRFGGSPDAIPQARPYPPVRPKFKNPKRASETWSGRGRQPLWVIDLLARGGSLEDCRIQ
jgi:DNA-binding protein H-NS